MSSTTSSDCDSCGCSQCTHSFESSLTEHGQCSTNGRHVPIYATMAHPLIYYAQVQPLNRKQNYNQPKKDNPFKKAFKWYTQERKAVCENELAPERSGFARWLDDKYSEYLRSSGQPNTGAGTKTCQCPKPRRRLKSPGRKGTANDSGDIPQKCPEGSCQYILKPQELSRAASENRYHTPASTGKSNATIESPCNAKCSRRSQSLTDVSPEKHVYNKRVEPVPLTKQEFTYISCDCPQQRIEYPPLTKCKQAPECLQQNVPEAVQVPSKQIDSRNQPEQPCTCQKEKVTEICKEPSKQLDCKTQPGPCCTCQKEKGPVIVKELSKEQFSINQPVPPCMCQKENVLAILKELTKGQDSINQPEAPYKCSQERETVEKLQSYHAEVVQIQLEKIPEVVKEVSYYKEAQQAVDVQQVKKSDVVEEPSKAQESTNEPYCKCEKNNVPKEVQVPSEDRYPRNLPGSYCSCHVKKVPEVVQVPSQCRAVEEWCQCSELKQVPVCQETQYEAAPTPLCCAQNHGPCCCNVCKPAAPPPPQKLPQIFCIPVQVQDRKVSSPELCVKQNKVKHCTPIATQCCEGIKSKLASPCQHEICACGKDNRSSCNCHDERQVCDPIAIKRESCCTVAVNKDTCEYSTMKEVAVVNKLPRCSTCCASNGAAQTSDHSIRFESDVCCSPYPLLFKIVYADVPKNE